MKGVRKDERSVNICRKDVSSLKRHKDGWHWKPESSKKCTIVPSSAPRISELRKKYEKAVEKIKSVENLKNVNKNSSITSDVSPDISEANDFENVVYTDIPGQNTCVLGAVGEAMCTKWDTRSHKKIHMNWHMKH